MKKSLVASFKNFAFKCNYYLLKYEKTKSLFDACNFIMLTKIKKIILL
jgi:hypothetical protein